MRLKFVPEGPIDNIPALVLIMAWRRPGDKTLSEPMMVSLLMYICVIYTSLCLSCSSLKMLIHDIMITAAHAVCSIQCSLIIFKQLHPYIFVVFRSCISRAYPADISPASNVHADVLIYTMSTALVFHCVSQKDVDCDWASFQWLSVALWYLQCISDGEPGGFQYKKYHLNQYRESYDKDEMVSWHSHHYNGNPYTVYSRYIVVGGLQAMVPI